MKKIGSIAIKRGGAKKRVFKTLSQLNLCVCDNVDFIVKVRHMSSKHQGLQSKRSVELPKTTHLPKTTENHLENHIYRGIIPS